MSVTSQRVSKWTFETRISGTLSLAIFPEAADQFRKGTDKDVRNWLLNVGDVAFDVSMLGMLPELASTISEAVTNLRATGVTRIVVVLPELARPFVSMIDVSPITVHSFLSRTAAVEWCRWRR